MDNVAACAGSVGTGGTIRNPSLSDRGGCRGRKGAVPFRELSAQIPPARTMSRCGHHRGPPGRPQPCSRETSTAA